MVSLMKQERAVGAFDAYRDAINVAFDQVFNPYMLVLQRQSDLGVGALSITVGDGHCGFVTVPVDCDNADSEPCQ